MSLKNWKTCLKQRVSIFSVIGSKTTHDLKLQSYKLIANISVVTNCCFHCFQTFRNYRTVFEEQKSAIEQRYRSLLEEAIQDAVFLSATNQDLMFENQQLKQGK